MVEQAVSVARPRACYEAFSVEKTDVDSVVVGGRTFTSLVLSHNLGQTDTAYAFVVTAGQELAHWSEALEPFRRALGWELQLAALDAAREAIVEDIMRRKRISPIGRQTPGSLADWPLTDQRPLFDLLGSGPETIGVRLSETLLMTPLHSGSGFFFHSPSGFVQCSLCPMPHCPARKAEYDPEAPARYGIPPQPQAESASR